MNSHLVAFAIALGANTDCQPVLTAKGVADYVAKYITKYGAGMSVTNRIASLLDDIIARTTAETTTVASVLSKAFIATAVPDSLCCLEAWHILWGLPRTVSSRFFKGLNMDGLVGVKNPKEVKSAGKAQSDQGEESMRRATPVDLYCKRLEMPCKSEALRAALPHYNLLRFTSELDSYDGGLVKRSNRCRVMKMKPYLQLDMKRPTAAKHARMALRMLRPIDGRGDDPWHLSDREALKQLEA